MTEPTDPESDLVARLFHDVVELDARARARLYRDRAVPESVRIEVEELLGEEPLAAFGDELVDIARRRVADRLQDAGPSVDWRAGTQIGDYEIVREIARGGMGVVFEARQLSLGRRVAIKVIRDSRFAGSSERQRFHAEAEAIARLEHSGILPVYEVAEHEGLPFFSMAFVAGGSLRDLTRPVTPGRAAELIAKVCDAVHYAHSQNIVHRDLKPANVLLTESLEPRVTDFGLAKDTSEDSDLTHTGAILGTPGFMAPEQAGGQQGAVSHLADVYGLGAVLFWLLTGHAPVEGQNLADTLHRVLHEDAPDPRSLVPAVPADLAGICRKALEKAPVRRYSSAAGLGKDLRRYLSGAPTEARPLKGRERVWRWCRRKPALAVLSVLTVLAIGGGIGASTWFAVEAGERAAELATANQNLATVNASLATANTSLEQQNEALAIARDKARSAQGDADAFSSFLVEDVIQSARPRTLGGGLGSDVTVRDALVAAIPKIDERFADRPVAGAFARYELAVTLRHADRPKIARDQLAVVHATRKRELGANAPATLSALNSYGVACYQVFDTETAIVVFEELVERARAHAPDLLAQALRNLGSNYERVDRFADQIAVYEEALPLTVPVLRPRAFAQLATANANAGRADAARALIAKAREELAEQPEATAYEAVRARTELIDCLRVLGDDEALGEQIPALMPTVLQVFGQRDPTAINLRGVLVGVYERLGRPAAAAAVLVQSLDLLEDENTPRNRSRMRRAVRLFLRANDSQQAHALALRFSKLAYTFGAESPHSYLADSIVCETLVRLGRHDEARASMRRVAKLRECLQRSAELPEKQRKSARRVLGDALARFERLQGKLR